MSARGEPTGAENGFRGVFAARQRTLGADHPDTLATQFAIAQQMAALGDHVGAEDEFRGVFAVRQRTLGADHPDAIRSGASSLP
jgi:eukaryotic-like serine/threonine-protein kinase